ncbi:MAG: putative mannose-phosphate guanyltransferase [Thermoleophilia bacterium]|jgi:NDP-sugar pyrophosphorylase family protein|nr:putative mannose-phosphate guanyltransferase [Thermoleophilia bacterium]
MTSVFVMAAGKGTRLAPWTSVVPKPVLPVANEPSLGYLLRLAARHGYRNVVANASWLADVLVDIIGDGTAYGVSLTWRLEDEPLGTAGGVIAARDLLDDGDEPILVLSGDGIHDIDLAAVERTHRESGALVTMALLPVADASEYGVAVLNDSGGVVGFQEKPVRGAELSNLANTGVYVVSGEALDMCQQWGLTDFGSELLPRLVDEGHEVQGHVLVDTYWNDIGDLDEWRASNHAVLHGAVDVSKGSSDDDGGAWGEGVRVHPTATVDASATLVAPVVIGAGATIAAGAYLRQALVLPYADVAPDQVVASGTVGSLDGLRRWVADLRADL